MKTKRAVLIALAIIVLLGLIGFLVFYSPYREAIHACSVSNETRLGYYLGSIAKMSKFQLQRHFRMQEPSENPFVRKYPNLVSLEEDLPPQKGDFPSQHKHVATLFRENGCVNVPLGIALGDCAPDTKEKANPIQLTKIRNNTTNGVLLPMTWQRWWEHVPDIDAKDIQWKNKKDMCVWRGTNTGQPKDPGGNRWVLCNRWTMSSLVDVGFSHLCGNGDEKARPYVKGPMSVKEMLRYRYIISAPGNDRDSGLQWKLASNSLVLMPKPLTQSWAMESELKPYVHYIPLDDRYDNLFEQLMWCRSHQDKCTKIVNRAKEWIQTFGDSATNDKLTRDVISEYCRIMKSVQPREEFTSPVS